MPPSADRAPIKQQDALKRQLIQRLHQPVTVLKGIGPKLAELLADRLGLDREPTIAELLSLRPTRLDHFVPRTELRRADDGQRVTIEAVVERVPSRRHGAPALTVLASFAGQAITLRWFRPAPWLWRRLTENETILVSGRLVWQADRAELHQPRFVNAEALNQLRPHYSGLDPRLEHRVVKAVREALAMLAPVDQREADNGAERAHEWLSGIERLHGMHGPDQVEAGRRSLARLEFGARQAILAESLAKRPLGRSWAASASRRTKLEGALPFALTESQRSVVDEIEIDLRAARAMRRLVQGDVGSGKTVVAALAALPALACAAKVAFLAPSEILARQHLAALSHWFATLDIRCVLCIGAMASEDRQTVRAQLSAPGPLVVVGTQAILSERAHFLDLGLVVIDEQHRFGVDQRGSLLDRAPSPDLLMLSATPIPRSLALLATPGCDVSQLTGKPPGRREIDTRLVSSGRMAEVEAGIGRLLAGGEKGFWVCPRISDDADEIALEHRLERLVSLVGDRVSFVHGQMSASDRAAAIDRSRTGGAQLLLATTVIEVGIDVPDAAFIVVEGADRFGLAQLHQLRGRVGRAGGIGRCVLIYDEAAGDAARDRLKAIRSTSDGFELAALDLKLRGPGHLLGTMQSGLQPYRFFDADRDADLVDGIVREANDLARRAAHNDRAASELTLWAYLFGDSSGPQEARRSS
ncbi:MAG: ATP-dependent DNA helicase RecG [Geminicoccaceae bacterium]